ncbi:hypothetical protein [Pseudomonas putida]|uniref:Uncharacterized protein n=1 Tax=Pseudomonas putida TaxID=303 RepID=A0A8I1EIE6_PSEPU|nr:hypothetical protein [Pseudomonas putida]MBI6885769.1 hypothetical protein [Pseudomonas putida]
MSVLRMQREIYRELEARERPSLEETIKVMVERADIILGLRAPDSDHCRPAKPESEIKALEEDHW